MARVVRLLLRFIYVYIALACSQVVGFVGMVQGRALEDGSQRLALLTNEAGG